MNRMLIILIPGHKKKDAAKASFFSEHLQN